MSTLSLRLPDSLHKKIKEIAKKENISINQFIASAVSEKMTALTTLSYLEERAKNANHQKYLKALAKITDIEPEDFDRL
jgi:predicted transcriptional regulator